MLRLGLWAEYRLSQAKYPQFSKRPAAEFNLLVMTGREHLILLKESLYSYLNVSKLCPHLVVVLDGTLTKAEILRSLVFWPNSIRVLNVEELLDGFDKNIKNKLQILAENHPLGIKLVAVLALSREGPCLFSDTDILWFQDPSRTLEELPFSVPITITQQLGVSINDTFAHFFGSDLINKTGPNTGLIWTMTDLSTLPILPELLEVATQNPRHYFNEQTILGILAQRYGSYFPHRFCNLNFKDADHIRHQKAWRQGFVSRHYVSFMRHHFYRDAIRLRQRNVSKVGSHKEA